MASRYSKQLTLIQKLEAAQVLWYAVNALYNQGDQKVVDWFKIKGVDEVRRICRGVYVVATFWEAREYIDNMGCSNLWPDLEEDYAPIFLKKCMSHYSMCVNRDWKMYLSNAIEEARNDHNGRG